MFAFLLSLFVIESLWFWFIFGAFFTLIAIFVDNEWSGRAFVSTLLFAFIIWYANGTTNIGQWLVTHYIQCIIWVVIYIIVGIAWAALCKTYLKGCAIRRQIEKVKSEFKPNEMSALHSIEDNWKIFLRNQIGSSNANYAFQGPSASSIILWMSYWPASMAWTLLNDPIRRFFKMIYELCLIGLFKKIHTFSINGSTTMPVEFKTVDRESGN